RRRGGRLGLFGLGRVLLGGAAVLALAVARAVLAAAELAEPVLAGVGHAEELLVGDLFGGLRVDLVLRGLRLGASATLALQIAPEVLVVAVRAGPLVLDDVRALDVFVAHERRRAYFD